MTSGTDRAKLPYYKDDEILVDSAGIPHFSGAVPSLFKEYRQRVLFAFQGLEGDGKTKEEEEQDLAGKQRPFARRLIDGLHGEAWVACQELLQDVEALKAPDAYKRVFTALAGMRKK